MRLECLFVKINIAAVLILAMLLLPPEVRAAPITIDSNTLRNFRDTRSLNDVGVAQGDRNVYGADVSPNIGTTITVMQGNRVDGPTLCNGNAVDPNNCSASVGFNPSRNGSWTLTFANGSDTATAVTPALDPAALLGPVPFSKDVTIAGTGVTPTLSWRLPSGFTPNAVRVRVYDKAQTNQRGQDVIIFSQPISGNQTSFTIPNGIPAGCSLCVERAAHRDPGPC